MLHHDTFETGELVLSYAEGPTNGPPLLLLHGLLGRWQGVEPVMQALGDHWHVHAVDLRGHGESGRAPQSNGYLLRDYVRDISAFVRQEIPEDRHVALFGFSLGALVALGTAAALPNRVGGLLLVEPPLMLRDHHFRELPIAGLIELAYETTRRTPKFEELLATCRTVMPGADEQTIVSIATQLSQIDPEVAAPESLERLLDGVDLTMLASIQCPFLLMHGEPALGSLVQAEDIAWVRESVPDAEIVPVAGAGHDIPVEVVVDHGKRFLHTLR